MRCFIALDLPPPVCNHLDKVSRESLRKGKIKRVPPEQMHVTLVFAGDVDNRTVSMLRTAVESVELHPMSFALDGFGRFPRSGEPHVIWAGLSGDLEELSRLQGRLAELAEAAGVEPDTKRFHAHVTLGRIKSPFGAYAVIDELAKASPLLRDKPFDAAALTLYTSELAREGPTYTPLLRRPITPSAGHQD